MTKDRPARHSVGARLKWCAAILLCLAAVLSPLQHVAAATQQAAHARSSAQVLKDRMRLATKLSQLQRDLGAGADTATALSQIDALTQELLQNDVARRPNDHAAAPAAPAAPASMEAPPPESPAGAEEEAPLTTPTAPLTPPSLTPPPPRPGDAGKE